MGSVLLFPLGKMPMGSVMSITDFLPYEKLSMGSLMSLHDIFSYEKFHMKIKKISYMLFTCMRISVVTHDPTDSYMNEIILWEPNLYFYVGYLAK
jgi:hypothetical protein